MKLRVLEFLNNYGDKGFIVLKTALEVALDPSIDHRLGDFSHKLVVIRLRRSGVEYNPSNILRILEREYGITERTYDSKRQRWWRFIDTDSVREALLEYTGHSLEGDPRLRLLLLKYKSIEPLNILAQLKRLAAKNVLTPVDKKVFRSLVFNELEVVVDLLESMSMYEDVFEQETGVLREILSLAEAVANKINRSIREKTSSYKDMLHRDKLIDKELF